MDICIANVLEATGGRLVQGDPAATLHGVATDSRQVTPGDLFVALAGERFDGHDFVARAFEAGAGAAVVGRWPDGLATDRPVVRVPYTADAYGALGAWWRRRMPARVVGITGSNGKTTCKEMIAHLLGALGPTVCSEANHNNHVGVPETLLRIRSEHRFAVVEMGTNHLGELEPLASLARPDVGLVTNIGPTHLAAFGSEEGVAREKGHLLDAIAPGGLAVLSADDYWSRQLAEAHPGRTATFGLSDDADWHVAHLAQGESEIRFVVAQTGDAVTAPVVGRWQVANCLAAIAVAAEMGLSVSEAAARLASFQSPKWRMNVRRIDDFTLLLDCYNANPASMLGALGELERRPCPGRRVVVLGDMLELGQVSAAAHRELGRLVAGASIDLLCAVGPEAFLMVGEALCSGMLPTNIFWSNDRAMAARWLCYRLRPNDTVLLKGSRGMRLEEVADAVVAWAEQPLSDRPVCQACCGSPAPAG